MKKVSVIIPTYGKNEHPYRAVDSVFHQSYPNVEVVIVDDNGKNTEQQLQNANIYSKYQNDNRFKYVVEEENKGGSVARNVGVKNCSGEYLCFLDDDDELADTEKIALQMQVVETLDETWAGTYSSQHIFNGKHEEIIKAKQKGHFVADFIKGKTSIQTSAPIISRVSYEKIGGFDESFIRHQDWEFFARLLNDFKLFPVPNATYNRCYKQNVKRKSADVRLQYMDHFVESMLKNITILPQKELNFLMKRKYVEIAFAFFREKRIKDGFQVCKKHKYNLFDYCYLFWHAFMYLIKSLFIKIK